MKTWKHRLIFTALMVFTFSVLITMWEHSVIKAQELNSLTIKIRTGNRYWSGTDDAVYFRIKLKQTREERSWQLDNPGHNDFERGHTDTFTLTSNLPDDVCKIQSIWIQKAADSWDGGWFLRGIEVYYNGDPSKQLYSNANIKKWLEDNHRKWAPDNFSTPECPPEPPPLACPGTGAAGTGGSGGIGFWNPSGEITPMPGDSDRDCYPDDIEKACGTDPNNPDTDGDGIPDGFEDVDRDCVVDAGETDATNPDSNGDGTLDGAYDIDGDLLADWRDPNNHSTDSDGDGWEDGPTNVRTYLELFKIECFDESFDQLLIGDDELFVVVDDVRFPVDVRGGDGVFDMSEGDDKYPMVDVASRVHSVSQPPNYRATIEFWEDDLFDFTDDFWVKKTLNFGEEGTFELEHRGNGAHYKLTFKAYRERFFDQNPNDRFADYDRDGILDLEEHSLSAEYYGMSDPAKPDIFMQLNWLGSDQEPEPYSKIDVVSQFYYHGYPIHLDDGDFGSGGKLPYKEEVSLADAEYYADTYMPANRHGLFHFVLAVDVVKEFNLGVARGPRCNDNGALVCTDPSSRYGLMTFKSDYLDHISDLESIVFMHELGHTLGLCHRPADSRQPRVVHPPRCQGFNPPQCNNCRDCSHYWISQDSDTAMGQSDGSWYLLYLDMLSDAVDREIIFENAEWAALNLQGIRCWPRTPTAGYPQRGSDNLCWPEGFPP